MGGECCSELEAQKLLEKRFKKVEQAQYNASSGGSVSIDRAVGDDKEYIAPPFHSNRPAEGLWFYSKVDAGKIMATINQVISSKPFEGSTNYSTAGKEMEVADPTDEVKESEVTI